MATSTLNSYTSFDGERRIAAGSLAAVALVVKRTLEDGASGPVLIFDDATGRSIDVDTRGSDEEVVARITDSVTANANLDPAASESIAEQHDAESASDARRGRGRPKLGVVAREVTLLPRHWEWLAAQPGGASVTLRKLVEEARRNPSDTTRARKAHERAYHFMSAIAGDLPGFEEATRALFANDRSKLSEHIAAWPEDVRDHITRLAFDHSPQ